MAKRKTTHTFRLQTMSLPELTEGMVTLRMRLNRLGILHRGRKLREGPLLNALVAWYLGLVPGDQEEIAREGLARFEELLDAHGDAADDPGPEAGRHAPNYDPEGEPLDTPHRKGKRA